MDFCIDDEKLIKNSGSITKNREEGLRQIKSFQERQGNREIVTYLLSMLFIIVKVKSPFFVDERKKQNESNFIAIIYIFREYSISYITIKN